MSLYWYSVIAVVWAFIVVGNGLYCKKPVKPSLLLVHMAAWPVMVAIMLVAIAFLICLGIYKAWKRINHE